MLGKIKIVLINRMISNKQITPTKIIGEGGSSHIIEAIVNYSAGNLTKGEILILKHCKGFLTSVACDLFIKEGKILEKLRNNLIDLGICNNFPYYYGYMKKCLFGSVSHIQDIIAIKYYLKPNYIPDILFHYSNNPELGPELYNILRNTYNAEFLLDIRNKLIIPNFDVIASKYLDINSFEDNIQEFLQDEVIVNCAPNIIMSRIYGFDLSLNLDFYLTDSLTFELIYTNSCLIKYNGKIFRDNHLNNIMIETYPYPRIYKIKDTYYTFNDGYRLVIIDAQVTSKAVSTRDLLGSAISKIPNKSLIENIVKARNFNSVIEEIIPDIYREYEINKDNVNELLVAYPNIRVWEYI